MKASLLTAVLLLALAAAPTEAMERSNSAGSLPAAGGRPLPLQHQGTLARLHGKGDVKKKIHIHTEFIKQATPSNKPDRAARAKQILTEYKQKGQPVTDQEAANFENQVLQRHHQLREQATAAADRSKKPFLSQYADLVRRQTQIFIEKVQVQQGKMTVEDHAEAQALAAAASEIVNQNAAQNGGPDLSDVIAVLIAAADQQGGLGLEDFGFPSLISGQPLENSPAVREFREKESHERQKFERIPAIPLRERNEREAHEMKAFHVDPAVLAVLAHAVLDAKLLQAINIATTVSNDLRKSGSQLSGVSPRGSKKLEIVQGSATNIHGASSGSSHDSQRGKATVLFPGLEPVSIQSSGQSSHSPRGSLLRQGSGSNLLQGKCYIKDPMELRAAIAQNHVPLKFYGLDDFTVGQIGKVESKSLTSGKSSLAQGSLYSYVFAIFAKRSAAMQQSYNGKYWETSAYFDLTILSNAKGAAARVGKAVKNLNPLHTKKTKIVDEEYVNYVASIFFHKCIPQNCEQRDIYGFYKALVRSLNGLESRRAISLIHQQLEIEIQQRKTGHADNVLPNPCPTEPNPERF